MSSEGEMWSSPAWSGATECTEILGSEIYFDMFDSTDGAAAVVKSRTPVEVIISKMC